MMRREKPGHGAIVAPQHDITLLSAKLLGKAAGEDLHLLHGLLVAASLRRRDTVAPGGESVLLAMRGGEGLSQQLPRRRIGRVDRYRALQVNNGSFGISRPQVLVAQTEAQQSPVLAGGEQALKVMQRHSRSRRRIAHATPWALRRSCSRRGASGR